MRFRSILLVFAAGLFISGLGYAGWRYVHERQSHICAACRREVHERTRTLAVVNGKEKGYCCPACALWQNRQTGTPVEIVSLTEYVTGSRLSPDAAFLVRGSDVNSCSHHTSAVGLDKQPVESHFDRCSPSLIAFGSKSRAMAFAREHGGQVLQLADVAAQSRAAAQSR